ncbi:MAG: ABC transporter permease [Bacteroidales bacterium]|nr:ABC transporter permease [Bacteroidales bacterium]
MKASDIVILALYNLRRNTMRTILTSLGVAVGIGSLAAMISFAQGITGNISRSMENNDIFTGITATSRSFDLDNPGTNSNNNLFSKEKPVEVPLNDSVIDNIRSWHEVSIAFPVVSKPATIQLAGRSVKASLKAVPMEMGKYPPFANITLGRFFDKEDEPKVIISRQMLQQMHIILEDETDNIGLGGDLLTLPLDSVLGKELTIVTTVFDASKLDFANPRKRELPLSNEYTKLQIVGIIDNGAFSSGMFSASDVCLPSKAIDYVPCIDLRSIYDIMEGNINSKAKYGSVHIRVNEHKNLKTVKYRLEKMGFQVFSVGDKLDDIEHIFLMLDSIFAAVGVIALLVSILGIVNTLIMAIYERRKEIGIMKSLGGTQWQIKLIFYVEAALIGLIGGICGVVGGKLASQAASSFANTQIGKIIGCNMEFFDFSWTLALVAVLFSVIISVAASVYPANRAASIDPLDALRRE